MRRLVLPKTLQDLLNPQRQADLSEGIRLLNALQNLKFVINSGGKISQSTIQISGKNALLTASANIGLTGSVLVVGGGASGRMGASLAGNGGGGSGGEVRLLTNVDLFSKGSWNVVVGAGGIGSRTGSGGSDGASSFFDINEAIGGGTGGGQSPYSSANQGAYGGGGGYLAGAHSGATGLKGSAGGTSGNTSPFRGGGGGGAGGVGANGSSSGNGGAGTFISITGVSLPYGAGGGGGADTASGNGGSGIGGNGASEFTPNKVATAGAANTGAGGGGGGSEGGGVPGTLKGGDGGSGVVIVSYPGSPRGTGGTITRSGGNTIHTFTNSGTLVIS